MTVKAMKNGAKTRPSAEDRSAGWLHEQTVATLLIGSLTYLPLFLPLHGQHAFPALLAAAAQAAFGVDPLEALGQYVANVGQVQQKQRHAHDRVQYGRQFAAQRPRRHVTVTCETDGGKNSVH